MFVEECQWEQSKLRYVCIQYPPIIKWITSIDVLRGVSVIQFQWSSFILLMIWLAQSRAEPQGTESVTETWSEWSGEKNFQNGKLKQPRLQKFMFPYKELLAGTTGATEAHARIGTIDNIATGQRMGVNRTTASVLSENKSNCWQKTGSYSRNTVWMAMIMQAIATYGERRSPITVNL